MEHKAKSIRPFIGAKNFELSRNFYQDLGFEEVILGPGFSYYKTREIGFYLQDAYVKDWVDNTMLFLEVDNPSCAKSPDFVPTVRASCAKSPDFVPTTIY